MEAVGRVYAKALYDLASESNETQVIYKDILFIQDVITQNNNLVKFLSNHSVTKDEKKAIVTNIFSSNINLTSLNFMKLLIDKSRFSHIEKVTKEYQVYYYEAHNIKNAIIYSVKLLSDNNIQDIKNALNKKYSCDFVLTNKIDESLIAGIKVVIGDTIIDGSINNRIDRLQHKLMNK